MEHYGDITKIHGGELPPVDIITFGSPCQGLSYAGKRLGLADERSGLFTEAIRIIREMREATNERYPRYAVWENVPGAISSGSPAGSDFRAVLEAFTEAEVPVPRSGRWANAGMVRSQGVNLAWCVYNAQYFGVAQRRRRVFLVADFGGGCAGEILFVPQSLHGYFEKGGTPREGAAAYAESRAYAADEPLGVNIAHVPRTNCLNGWDTQQSRVYTEDGQSPTLAGADGGGGRNPAGLVAAFIGGAAPSARGIGYSEKVSPTLRGASGSNMAPCICEPETARTLTARGDSSPCVDRGQNVVAIAEPFGINGNIAGTLDASYYKGTGARNGKEREVVLCRATGQSNAEQLENLSTTLNCSAEQPIVCKAVHQNQVGDISTSDQAYTLSTAANATARNAPLVMTEAYGINATAINRQPHNGGNGLGVKKEISPTLTATDQHAVGGIVHPDVSGTLCASGAGLSRPAGMASETDLCVAYEKTAAVDCRNFRETEEISGTLQAKGTGGYSLNCQNPVRTGYIVRRLTPMECERLQGYPDSWTALGDNDKPISDTKRYQMCGNSVAVPCVAYILMNIAEKLQSNMKGKEKAGE